MLLAFGCWLLARSLSTFNSYMPLNKRIPHFEVSHFVRETNFKTHFMQIKNIIFDLGGVLLDVDYDATIQAF